MSTLGPSSKLVANATRNLICLRTIITCWLAEGKVFVMSKPRPTRLCQEWQNGVRQVEALKKVAPEGSR